MFHHEIDATVETVTHLEVIPGDNTFGSRRIAAIDNLCQHPQNRREGGFLEEMI